MTGTAETEAAEFASTYGLQVVPIPTHRPMVRSDKPDLIFKTEDAKFEAVVEDLNERYDKGQPVLVGTASVAKSEELSAALGQAGHPSPRAERQAPRPGGRDCRPGGRLHAITVATNMAGRGVDIVLGGNPEGLARKEVRAQGLDLDSEEGRERYQSLLASSRRSATPKPRGPSARWPLRARERAPREPAHRQPAPRPFRPSRRPRREPFLPVARGRADAAVRDRRRQLGHGPGPPRGRPDRGADGHQGDRAGPEHRRGRNAENRKELLKYDEVRNEQRKVIYARRLQIIDGEDLQAPHRGAARRDGGTGRRQQLPERLPEEWDLEGLQVEFRSTTRRGSPSMDLEAAPNVAQLTESILARPSSSMTSRSDLPGGTETAAGDRAQRHDPDLDQRWREHLVEMDYLNEGIHLRGIAQTDPLVAWQHEGSRCSASSWTRIDDDYLRYVMHVQVLAAPAEDPDYAQAAFVAADDPAAGMGELAQVPAADGGSALRLSARDAPGTGAAAAGSYGHRRPAPRPCESRPARSGAASRGTPNRGGNGGGTGRAAPAALRPDIADRERVLLERTTAQSRAQRAVLVWQRPQVQGLPRRELRDRDSSIRRRTCWSRGPISAKSWRRFASVSTRRRST